MTSEARTESFVSWLKNNGVKKSSKVQIATCDGQGRCVVATEDIETGEEICKIPHAAILNVKNCSLAKDTDFAATLQGLPDWEGLILAFMYEWKVKKGTSPWLQYFDILPLNDKSYTMNQLNFWSEEELNGLQPSLVLDRIGLKQADEMYARLEPRFAECVGDVSKDDFNLIASIVMSYSFDLDNEGEDEEDAHEKDEDNEKGDGDEDENNLPFLKSLVPFADTLNAHSRLQNAYVHEEGEFLIVEATKPIPKGVQVYNTYSVESNAELLRMYGYVEEQPMKHDVAEISLDSIKQYFAEMSSLSRDTIEEIVTILREIESEEEESFVFDTFNCYADGEVDRELTFVVQFFVIISAINRRKSFNSASFTLKSRAIRRVHKKVYQFLMGEKVTKGLLEHYTNIVKIRLLKYPKIAGTPPWKPEDAVVPSRSQMARMVIFSEHQVLIACSSTSVLGSSVIDDGKLLRNIMNKDVFEEHTSKKQKLK